MWIGFWEHILQQKSRFAIIIFPITIVRHFLYRATCLSCMAWNFSTLVLIGTIQRRSVFSSRIQKKVGRYVHVTPPKRVASSFGRGYKIFEPITYQPPSFLRGCAGTATARERKSHAVRRVRLDAKAASPGLGVAPTSVSENPKEIFRYIARLRYPESGIPHTIRAKSIHQVLPMLSECASKNSFYICIVIPARKDFSPGTRSRSPPWPSMIFRTEESPIP